MARSRQQTKGNPKLYLESKLKRVLEGMGVDFDKVKRAYEQDPGQRGRRGADPRPEDIQAVERFLQTGDFDTLRKALGVRSLQTAHATVARVMAFKARGKAGREAVARRTSTGSTDMRRST